MKSKEEISVERLKGEKRTRVQNFMVGQKSMLVEAKDCEDNSMH